MSIKQAIKKFFGMGQSNVKVSNKLNENKKVSESALSHLYGKKGKVDSNSKLSLTGKENKSGPDLLDPFHPLSPIGVINPLSPLSIFNDNDVEPEKSKSVVEAPSISSTRVESSSSSSSRSSSDDYYSGGSSYSGGGSSSYSSGSDSSSYSSSSDSSSSSWD